ncbi:group-specific protein [Chengkuizengella axinellae]|uniref:Group-specific protein n=1 Tax=Chengkuizengella axinellae TaxID=3064388 RepID=A0ABT9IXZ6_9BACL|nr:group-specific protein [Chengkuizengella sp. 2205SS18-9]MDP5273992.1 group-specific protein [Chengkuizengella sp. 2205SS18-9]
MLSVQVDEKEVRKLCKQKIVELIKEVDAEYVFWDTAELKRRTCMSWSSIQDTFFFDPRFIKRKVGQKWYFPARATRKFLETWLEEQP